MLIEIYEKAMLKGQIQESSVQKHALTIMQSSFDMLHKNKILRCLSWLKPDKKIVAGIYLYGTVGVGKTYIADLFYNNAKIPKKRMHFFYFMQTIHEKLKAYKGIANPLEKIAKDFAKHIKLLFIDELMVYDIADAMIIGELLKLLRENNVFLLLTSNIAPTNLYEHGLQRKRFLSLISFINTDFDIINCASNYDYRLHKSQLKQLYWSSCNKSNLQSMKNLFESINIDIQENVSILIQNRKISVKYLTNKAIWFDFDILCNIPRCSLDYIELASKFDYIFINTVPKFNDSNIQQLIFFMQLIDVLYDKGIPIIICAVDTIDNLYTRGSFIKQFQRTKSRLHEMQSMEYS